jgi:hypothetical protein
VLNKRRNTPCAAPECCCIKSSAAIGEVQNRCSQSWCNCSSCGTRDWHLRLLNRGKQWVDAHVQPESFTQVSLPMSSGFETSDRGIKCPSRTHRIVWAAGLCGGKQPSVKFTAELLPSEACAVGPSLPDNALLTCSNGIVPKASTGAHFAHGSPTRVAGSPQRCSCSQSPRRRRRRRHVVRPPKIRRPDFRIVLANYRRSRFG